jgi:hypothetical protein
MFALEDIFIGQLHRFLRYMESFLGPMLLNHFAHAKSLTFPARFTELRIASLGRELIG